MPTSAKTAKSTPKAKATPKAKSATADELEPKAAPAKKAARKSTGPAKAAAEKSAPPKRGKAGKAGAREEDDTDLSDIEADLEGEPEAAAPEVVEKAKPLRMKISKAKERALMKEFGLDEGVLSEEEMNTRRANLKALLKLGKTRGYLTHGEINDHLPDKLVDAETLEAVVSMLNDLGVAVYEQTP
uniref:RNA polymerase sigma factor region1.1 domain-containing protein n=1 Tax=Ottowia sp. TaxID=1898956 RepID=UPI0025E870BA